MKSRYPFILIAVIFVFCMTTFMASMVEARGGRGGGMRGGGGGGGRGGGGFSRGGPAAGGGFSSRSTARQTPRQETRREQPRDRDRDRDDWQERRDEIREDRQEHLEDAREDRQDFIDDERDDYYDHYRHYGGAAFVTYAPCSTTVVIGGSTYYHCGSTWYSRGYEGGDVVYIVTSAPAGH
jgi:hypothetical protein